MAADTNSEMLQGASVGYALLDTTMKQVTSCVLQCDAGAEAMPVG
jgi:hypothetical protein